MSRGQRMLVYLLFIMQLKVWRLSFPAKVV